MYGNSVSEDIMSEFDIIIDKIQLFQKMYDSMRIVDPARKEILEFKENALFKIDSKCYKLWKRQGVCENCVSMRAYNEDDTIIKMEHNGSKVYMLTAVPISILGRKLVVELFKDATNSLYFGSGELGCKTKMITTIEHMNQTVVKDELTDLYNRRYIYEKLPHNLLKSSLKNEPLSIIFADLDFFKLINDTYGHIAGDQVLREFAEELKRHIRNGRDWAARFGGEEFIICLPNTDIDAARAVAERIRESVMKKEIIIGNEGIHLTASFGVHTVCNRDECLTVDGIIEIADKKLYKAKSEGRNRVI